MNSKNTVVMGGIPLVNKMKEATKKIIRTIYAVIWIIGEFKKFKHVLKTEHDLDHLHPYGLSLWRNGTKYFIAYHAGTNKQKVFIKTIGKHNNLLNEWRMLTKISERIDADQRWKVPRVISINNEGQYPFIALEFIKGVSLSKLISKNRLSREDKILIASEFLNIIDILHNHRIVHRDLRPDNILVRKENGIIELILIDFALSVSLTDFERNNLDSPPKNILKVLGSEFKPKPFVWDDAYSLHRIIQIMDTANEINKELLKNIESKIGKITYQLHC